MSISHIASKCQDGKSGNWLPKDFLLFGSALAIFVAIFAARFSVSRVFREIFPQWFVLGEMRTWAILAAAALVLMGWMRRRTTDISPVHLQRVWTCVGLVVVTQVALMAHALLYLSGASPVYFAWELTTIILIAGTFGLAFQVWGIRLVNAVMWLALSFALLIALWMLLVTLGVNKTDVGGPLATTFTFYRIQIFGGFAALVILFGSNKVVRVGLLGLCATICFAAAYISLSKAALLAGTGSMLFLAAVYVTWFSKIRAGVVLSVSISAVILFVIVAGGMFAARSAEGLLGTGYALSTSAVLPPIGEDSTALNMVRFEAQKSLAEVVACTAGNYPCAFTAKRWEQDIADTMLRFRVYIPDFSFRIRLLMKGMSGVAQAPWMGNGFGTFNAVATNLYTKEPEPYSHPHNIVIELLYSVGIMGAMLVGGIIFVLVWLVMQAREGVQPSLPMLAYVVSVCIGSVFGGDYMDFRLAWFGLLVCSMLCEVGATGPADDRHAA